MPQNPLEPNEFANSNDWTHPSQLPETPKFPRPSIRAGLATTGIVALGGAAIALALIVLITPGENRRVVTSTLAGLSTPAGATSSSAIDLSTQPGIVTIEVTNADGVILGIGVSLGDNKILTNASLVTNAQTIHYSAAGLTAHQKTSASIIGIDVMSDIAVLNAADLNISVARLGFANELRVGTKVAGVKIENDGQVQSSDGQIYLLNELATSTDGKTLLGMISTDLTTSGPMMDSSGTITGFLARSAPGHALPIDDVRTIVAQIVTFGHAQHGWIGLRVRDDNARGDLGAVIEDIAIGSPGHKAGLQVGDRITALDDDPIYSSAQLLISITQRRAGDPVVIEIRRNGIRKKLPLSLEDRPVALVTIGMQA